ADGPRLPGADGAARRDAAWRNAPGRTDAARRNASGGPDAARWHADAPGEGHASGDGPRPCAGRAADAGAWPLLFRRPGSRAARRHVARRARGPAGPVSAFRRVPGQGADARRAGRAGAGRGAETVVNLTG